MSDVANITGIKAEIEFTSNAKSVDKVGKEVGKKVSEGMTNIISKEMKDKVGKAVATGLENSIYPKSIRGQLTEKYPKYLEKQLSNMKKKVNVTKEEIAEVFKNMPMPKLGTGGIGTDYVGKGNDYGKIVEEAKRRAIDANKQIQERMDKQSMYESLFKKLDNDKATVFSRENIVNGNKMGMAIDVVKSKLKSLKPLIEELKKAFKPIKEFFQRVIRISIYRAIRAGIKAISQAIREGTSNLYQWSKIQGSGFGDEFAKSLDRIATAFLAIKNSVATAVAPIITGFTPAIEKLALSFKSLSESVAQYFATLMNVGYYFKAKDYNLEYADSIKAVKKQLMGFDELNVLNTQDTGSVISDYSNLFDKVVLDDTLEQAIAEKMVKIGAIMAGAQLALGAILLFTGINVPLGLGLMVTGALTIGKTIQANWDALSDEMKTRIAVLTGILSMASLAIGAILLFSGVKPALGIGLIIAGVTGLIAEAQLNWDSTTGKVKDQISAIMAVISAATLALGVILALTGNWKLGIPLIVAGVAGMVTVAAINWDAIKEKLQEAWGRITIWFKSSVEPKLKFSYWQEKGRNIVDGIKSGLQNAWASLKSWFTTAWDNLFNKSTTFSLSGGTKLTADTFANGGTPDIGTLFWAGEAGAEVVTQVGGRNTVYNEQQLGSSLAYANEAVVSAILSSASSIMQSIAENKTEVNIGDREIARAASRGSKLTGNSLIQGA